jgi:hypothetical protein
MGPNFEMNYLNRRIQPLRVYDATLTDFQYALLCALVSPWPIKLATEASAYLRAKTQRTDILNQPF